MGVFLTGESGGVQGKRGGRGETHDPEEVEMDMVSSRYSGLLSLVEMKVLELEHRVLEEPHWRTGVKGSRSKD